MLLASFTNAITHSGSSASAEDGASQDFSHYKWLLSVEAGSSVVVLSLIFWSIVSKKLFVVKWIILILYSTFYILQMVTFFTAEEDGSTEVMIQLTRNLIRITFTLISTSFILTT